MKKNKDEMWFYVDSIDLNELCINLKLVQDFPAIVEVKWAVQVVYFSFS
jgi:hypothetical protein